MVCWGDDRGSDSESGATTGGEWSCREEDGATAGSTAGSTSSTVRKLELTQPARETSRRSMMRRASTADTLKAYARGHQGTRAGSRIRLESRTDFQEAFVWMEGAENIENDDVGDYERLMSREDSQSSEASASVRAKQKQMEGRYLLPFGLASSLAASGVCMYTVQQPLLQLLLDGFLDIQQGAVTLALALLYGITGACMLYAGLHEPGQINAKDYLTIKYTKPERSHKSWQYLRPIRRYDHYCRWLCNCIGLLNHREFFVMVLGIVGIAVVGVICDLWLLYEGLARLDVSLPALVALMAHLIYSTGLGYYVLPIVRLHVLFISRNELAEEWKTDSNYVVDDKVTGEPIKVKELSEDDFDELFDSFRYEPSLNPWDHGCLNNCLAFWCTPRCGDTTGDF
eukprot:TRINITY_DN81250_c0_g1_i1.p1 TRINITY_DN81250_c0_g1~~TRINITY_DN81250_c0_g1_i1.p1  ORF type:complete len:399 (-),score=56.30 TRINITY_DN81250_c0_g1_i1:157-1353(-)